MGLSIHLACCCCLLCILSPAHTTCLPHADALIACSPLALAHFAIGVASSAVDDCSLEVSAHIRRSPVVRFESLVRAFQAAHCQSWRRGSCLTGLYEAGYLQVAASSLDDLPSLA